MKHLVILVHGIRTFAYWMHDITPVLEKAGFAVAPTSYGRFNMLRFIFPGSAFKRTAIERIRKEILAAVTYHNPEQVSIIAHSFGTFVISQILASEPHTRWNRIIFCGSVVPQRFPFGRYLERFQQPILNEIGSKDFLPALAESITWGYGSIGTHGLNDPFVRNRWNEGFSHSDFLTPEFVERCWIPFIREGTIAPGAKANPSLLSRIVARFPLRWVVVLAIALSLHYSSYLWIPHQEPEANVAGCEPYRASSALTWRAENLRLDQSGTYYVIVKSYSGVRSIPFLGAGLANLDAYLFRRWFPRVDFDAMPTANADRENQMWALVLARAVPDKAQACRVRTIANRCGISKSAYVYRLSSSEEKGRPEGC